jgi:hypothetical protein
VDETDKSPDGDLMTELIGKRMQQQLFSGAGEPVKTQAAEVKKRQSDLVNAVHSEQALDAQKTKLKEIVLPLANTALERANWRQKIDNVPAAQIDAEILGTGSLFDAAFQDANGATNLAAEPRRDAIARFLFSTASPANPQEYQRAMVVVGLSHYSREVERQAAALADMVPELELAMAAERTDFEKMDRALIQEILARAERIRRLQGDVEKQRAQLQQYNVLIADRNRDVKDLLSQIDVTLNATKKSLAQQGEFEQALFKAQKDSAAINAANQKLESEIKTRELGH